MELVFTLQTNKVGSKCYYYVEVDDREWVDLDEIGREDYAKEMFWDYAMDHLGSWDWYVKEKI